MSVFILGGKRTPIGGFLGDLSSVSATELGGKVIEGLMKGDHLDQSLKLKVDQVIMGNVISAGVGQAPARQASLKGGLDESVPAVTINKVCGSGMEALRLSASLIQSGENQLTICGGMESMSQAPHLLQMRLGQKFGNAEFIDAMVMDGLKDVYSLRSMGECAEVCVDELKISREEQDQFAINSFKKSNLAQENGVFKSEIVPVQIQLKKEIKLVSEDEGPKKVQYEKIPKLPPAFSKNGSITAANSSTLNDGASALLIGGDQYKNLASFKILSFGVNAQNPTWFTTAPVGAVEKALKKANLKMEDIDLWEINEAFAMVVLAAQKALKIDSSKINIHGGAISLGHPLGSSGSRIVVSLMNAMTIKKSRLGVAALCIGGGEGIAMVIERI
jgi:acetyl-CoA C-acetyltransferase